jgi:hypothetical protein
LKRKTEGQRLTVICGSATLQDVMRTQVVLVAIVLSVSCLAQSSPRTSGGAQAEAQAALYSEQDASKSLGLLKKGAESHDLEQILSAFDSERMDGYLTLEGQADEFVRRYDPVRFYFRILQTSIEGGKGIAMVEIQMEAEPRDSNGVPIRRDQQFRFEFMNGKAGWKIVALTPAQLFTP